MFGWLFRKKDNNLEKETRNGFSLVKNDIKKVGKWIKHLDSADKQLFDLLNDLRGDLSSVKEDLGGLKEAFEMVNNERGNKQVFKKLPVLDQQTAVVGVVKAVQTAVQTGNIYEILRGLSSNERLLVMTLMNAGEGIKLSYEDLALLLGKERSTVRGQINMIKQKSEGLIEEIIERNGKKRVFVPDYVRQKLQKYAKVRVGKMKKDEENG